MSGSESKAGLDESLSFTPQVVEACTGPRIEVSHGQTVPVYDGIWEVAEVGNVLEGTYEEDNIAMAALLISELVEGDSLLMPNASKARSRDSKFDFREPLEVVCVYESQPIVIIRRETTCCFISPHSIAFQPRQHKYLVTEPDRNRVGCYQADFKFVCWLKYPKQYAGIRQNYEYPTSILTLTNECLALLEIDRLHIFDPDGIFLQSFGGEFNGLSEGQTGEIYTLGNNSLGQPVIMIFEKDGDFYKGTGQIVITAIQNFDNWEVLSQARFILYSKQKIYITDEGLHKLYVIDLVTRMQIVSGYLGSKSGQFKRPTGLMADELGNVLVGDSDNNRQLLFNEEGKFLKVLQQQVDCRYPSPHGLMRKDMSALIVYRGEGRKDNGIVVKYKMLGDSGLNTPDTGSEIGN